MSTHTAAVTAVIEVNWGRGLCRDVDPDVFFLPETEQLAQSVCRRCDIREGCLSYALSHQIEYGVWGGLTESDRRHLRSKRHRVRCPGCRGLNTGRLSARVEFCRGCGLSWPV